MSSWAMWQADRSLPPYTVGIEEEVMLVDPDGWALAPAVEQVLEELPDELRPRVTSETHSAAVELATGVHFDVGGACAELTDLRAALTEVLDRIGLAGAVAGTHPFAVWQEMAITQKDRHQFVFGSMRALARREPTFALHVHVGVPDPEQAVRAANRMRAHLPLLLALSSNSPFWQGRDTGLASARTPLFQAFPRVGIPRAFRDYDQYVNAVDLLIRTGALPDATFLWWDVRLQPRFGTVEVRVMDAGSTLTATRALTALVQCLVALEGTEGFVDPDLVDATEVLDENRFLAARDGTGASLVDVRRGGRIPLDDLVSELLDACAPYAERLGCAAELELVPVLLRDPSAQRQRRLADLAGGLPGLVATLAGDFARPRATIA